MQKIGLLSLPVLHKSSDYTKYLFGVFCKIISISCFCILSLSFEHAAGNVVSPLSQYGIICALGVLILFPILLMFYRQELLASNFRLYLVRAFFSLVATVSWFQAINLIGSPKAMLVTYICPILIISFAGLMGIERLQKGSLALCFTCYLIVFYVLNNDYSIDMRGLMFALISAVFWAFYEIICKKQTQSEHYLIQVFGTLFFSMLMLLPVFYADFLSMGILEVEQNLAISIIRIFNCITLFLAIKYATLNWVVPVSYTKFPIMVMWAYLLNGTTVEPKYYLASALLILLNVIIMKFRKQ